MASFFRIILFMSISFMLGVISMDLVHDLSVQNGSRKERELLHQHAKFLVESFDKFSNWATYLIPIFLMLDLISLVIVYLSGRKAIDLISLLISIIYGVVLFAFHVPSLDALRASNLEQFVSISQTHFQYHLICFSRHLIVVFLQFIMLINSNTNNNNSQKKKK